MILCYRKHCGNKIQSRLLNIYHSTEARDRSFYPTFNKRFDHLEAFLTICRPKKAGSLCGSLVPSPQSKYPKRTFMLPQKYHVSVSNILSKPLKCFMENENISFRVKPSDPLQSAATRALL